MSKQATYDSLCEKYKEKITIAKIVQGIASNKASEQYMGSNTILLIIISITALIDMLTTSLVGSALDIYMIYLVATRTAEQYSWITARAFFSLMQIGTIVIALKSGPVGADHSLSSEALITIGVLLALSVSSMILGFYLGKRLCPEYEERKIIYTDNTGKKKVRVEHEFFD